MKTVEKTKASVVPSSLPVRSAQLPFADSPLMNEIDEWKIEHNRYERSINSFEIYEGKYLILYLFS